MEQKDFEFSAAPAVAGPALDDGFSPDDFRFVQQDSSIHEQRFQGRSTTYLKDIARRFVKNKSSVFGFCLFGLIVLLAIFFAIFLPGNANKQKPTPGEQYLPPKLFPAGTGFWDGTRSYTNYLVDPETGMPALNNLNENAIVGEINTYDGTYAQETPYGHGGYVMINAGGWLSSPVLDFTLVDTGEDDGEGNSIFQFSGDYTLSFDQLTYGLDTSYVGEPTYSISYTAVSEGGDDIITIPLATGLPIGTEEVDLVDYLNDATSGDNTIYREAKGRIRIQAEGTPIYFKGLILSSSTSSSWADASFTDANAALVLTSNNERGGSSSTGDGSTGDSGDIEGGDTTDEVEGLAETDESGDGDEVSDSGIGGSNWWKRSSSGAVHGYDVEVTLCDFVYDPYMAVYGNSQATVSSDRLDTMKRNGIIDFETDANGVMIVDTFKVLDETDNYIVDDKEKMQVKTSTGIAGTTWELVCEVYTYKTPTYGYKSMPIHVFGTDVMGLDMLKLVSIGLLYSLLIGVAVSAICFCIGLAWGSFSGYEGGVIDLGMERVVDILSYIPSMVTTTLFILNWGHKFWVFMLAMCVTGWIGTSSLTRTQFYRFKRREYVLASRSLGASDFRLIYRHILPNGLGTIITSSVLMIPSVIYSEASLAYLGLGLQDITSLGTIIQNNQNLISTAGSSPDLTYLILFPSIILALLLICFELFGQGLRDAVNPNTKGVDD